MKYETKRKLILVSAILMLASALGSLSSIFSVVMKNSVILEIVRKGLEEANNTSGVAIYDGESFLRMISIMLIVGHVISFAISVACSVFYFNRYKFTQEEFESKKTSLIVWTVINLLIVGNIIVAVCSFVAVFSKSPSVKPDTSVGESTEQESDVVGQINRLKQLKESGAITEEEYTKLLSNIIK